MTTTLQLLAANRSFQGVRSAPKRFKQVDTGYLPHFGPSASFRPAAGSACAPEPDYGPLFARPTLQQEGTGVDADVAGEQRLPTHDQAQPATHTEAAAKDVIRTPGDDGRKHAAIPTARLDRFNPFQHLGWRKRAVEPTQGEFRLTKVKVVRNDLGDADLEIVVAGPAGRQGTAGKTNGADDTASIWTAWRRWVARWRPVG